MDRVRFRFLDAPLPLAFAHRGGAAHQPENTWPAFERAVGLGYGYLETDARATSDGVLLAFHDANLDRVTDSGGEVVALPYRQVAAARVRGSEPIPRIEDLLGAWPHVRFNIDLKHEASVEPLDGVLRRTAAWDRVCVTSFSGRRLALARQVLARPVCTAVTPGALAAARYAGLAGKATAERIARSGAQCAQIPHLILSRSFVRYAHDRGLQVHAWTLNTKVAIERALEAGADGIMTDNLTLLRDVLAARGLWHPGAVS